MHQRFLFSETNVDSNKQLTIISGNIPGIAITVPLNFKIRSMEPILKRYNIFFNTDNFKKFFKFLIWVYPELSICSFSDSKHLFRENWIVVMIGQLYKFTKNLCIVPLNLMNFMIDK